MMWKKGAWEMETLGKALLAIALLVVLLGIIFALSGRGGELLEKLSDVFRFR